MQELDRRRFSVNGPDGYVIIKDEPGSKKNLEDMYQYINKRFPSIEVYWENPVEYINGIIKYNNGQELIIWGVYIHEGKYWGVMESGH